ncbi:MAG: OmpA family protein [Panacagrimonas sp.]
MNKLIPAFLFHVLCFASLGAWAADKENSILEGDQVTESNLVDALSITPNYKGVDPSAATRGFRPARPGESAPARSGPGKASLLITFATNSSQVRGEVHELLDTLGRALQSDNLAGFSFRVEGHADARGDADINTRLSQERAQAVVEYLVAQAGILPERLLAVGKGSKEPMNTKRVDAPENRRVTIVTVQN